MASRDLRGLTIEIGGDTSNLTSALRDVDGELSNLQSNLRTVNSALRLDPGNVDALAQRQALLTDAVAETTRRLETLREAQRQVDQQIADGVEIDERAYRNLQTEIIRAEASLADYERQANEAGDNSQEAAENAAEGWTIVKDVIADLASQAVQAAIESFKDLLFAGEQALDMLQAKTGLSSDAMKYFGDAARDVFKGGWGESLSDVSGVMAEIYNTLGDMDADYMKAFTENAMTLTDVFGWDTQEQLRAVNSLMNQFGLTSDEAFNLMVQGAQLGLDQNGDLLDTINEYSVQFKDAGYSADDMFNMLANGAETGTWSVDKLGDAVKEMNIRVSDGTADEAFQKLGLGVEETIGDAIILTEEFANLKTAQEKYNSAVAKYGQDSDQARNAQERLSKAQAEYNELANETTVNISDIKAAFAAGGEEAQGAMQQVMTALLNVEDETERYNLGVQIFGTMWEDLGEEAVAALLTTEGGIKSTNEAMSQVKTDAYDNLATSITTLGRTLKSELLDPVVNAITPAIKGIVSWTIENMEIVKPIIIGVATAFGVLAGALAISGIISAVQKAMVLLNATLLANPITLVVAAIAGLVAAFVTAYKNSETFRDIVNGAMQAVWSVVQPIAESIKNALVQAWELIKVVWEYCEPFFTLLWNNIKTGAEFLKNQLVNVFQLAWTTIKSVWAVVSSYFQNIWNTIAGIFSVVKSVLSGDFQGAWDAIKGIVSGWAGYFRTVWDSIKNIFGGVVTFFKNTFSNAWTAVKGVFSNWGSFFGGLWDSIKNKFSSIGTSIASAIGGAVKSGINGVISSIERTINSGVGLINGAIGLINKIPGVSVGRIGNLNLPRLASGHVAREPMIAEIGEYPGASRNPEIVTPQNILRDIFEETLAKHALDMSNASGTNADRNARKVDAKLDALYDIVAEYLPHLAKKTGVYVDKKRLVGELISDIDEGLGEIANRRAVGAV